MGKLVEKKKKKGRPSLLDLQKRSLKQQQQQQQLNNKNKKKKKTPKFQNPNPKSSLRRSTRRNPNPSSDEEDDQPSSPNRREKKLNLVLDLPQDENSGPDSNLDDEGSSGSGIRKRKIGSIGPGSGPENHDKGRKHSASAKQENIQQGSKPDDGPSTPLPDKKLLLFILDRLQKKDSYGVFSEPVDEEELPDYHEVIEHPMDFSTVRKKLDDGAYASLEQFEKDIFLICSNAMEYNAPDTIYFRQARSIQELAKKNFENLRQDSDDNEPEPEPEPEPKTVRRGRPPTKNLKRPPGRPPLERGSPNLSEATLATSVAITNRFNDVRKGLPVLEKQGSADLFARTLYGLRHGDAHVGSSADRYERSEDMTGSASKGNSVKQWKKNIVLEENRRNTYLQTSLLGCGLESSVLTTFDGERKFLIPVGLHPEYGYARSLSRFAAKLGPAAWRIASRKIEKCLPAGVKFGHGWVGENEAPAERPTPQQLVAIGGQPSPPASLFILGDSSPAPSQGMLETRNEKLGQKTPDEDEQLSEVPTSSQSKLDDKSSKVFSPSPAGDATPASCSQVIPSNDTCSKLNASEASSLPNTTFNVLNSTGAVKPDLTYQTPQNSRNQSRVNGLNGSYGLNFAAQMGKMIGAARPSLFNLQSNAAVATVSRNETQNLGQPSGDNKGCGEAMLLEKSNSIKPSDCLPNAGRPKVGSGPPDLNVGFQSPVSPGSGRTDSLHPDLALQL